MSVLAQSYKRVESAGRTAAPIGVFDTGAGGLTILSTLRKELPYENYIYFGDTANCPYGTRSDAEILELSTRAMHFLVEQGTKLIVVACNTVSLVALNRLRATFSIPFVGVVPAVKPASRATKNGRIGVALTNHAAKSPYLHWLINQFATGIQVHTIGCSELVPFVERGEFDGPLVEQAVRDALQPLLREGVDVIVLGCTHFPVLRSLIEDIAGHDVQVIDSALAIANRTRTVLDAEALIHHASTDSTPYGGLEVLCSGDASDFSTVASKLLGYPVFARQTLSAREPSAVYLK